MKHRKTAVPSLFFALFGVILLVSAFRSWEKTTRVIGDATPASVILANEQDGNYVVFDVEDMITGDVMHNALGNREPYTGDDFTLGLEESDFASYARIHFTGGNGDLNETARLVSDSPHAFGEIEVTVTGFIAE